MKKEKFIQNKRKIYKDKHCDNIEKYLVTEGGKTFFSMYFPGYGKLLKIDITRYMRFLPNEMEELLDYVIDVFIFICENGAILDD